MSDRPALEVAKKLNEKIEGFVGYSRSHHDIGLELMRAAQSACTAIEQLSDTVESLQRENEELRTVSKGNMTFWHQKWNELRGELDEARAAAITPEMRERMGALLLAFDEGFLEMEEAALNGINIIRGLLGEQG